MGIDAEKLNELGRQWYGLSAKTDGAAKKALEEQIFIMMYSMAKKQDQIEAIGEFFLEAWPEFDPNKGDLLGFFWRRVKFLASDLEGDNKDKHMPRKLQQSISAPILGTDGTATLEDQLENEDSHQTPENPTMFDSQLLEAVTLFLNLSERLTGRAKNADKIRYYKIFYTAGIVGFIRHETEAESVEACEAKERDIFQAMELGFLDFFESEICRTLDEIFDCRLKTLGELVGDKSKKTKGMDDEATIPFPNKVYVNYLNVKDSTVSEQLTAYKKFLKDELC